MRRTILAFLAFVLLVQGPLSAATQKQMDSAELQLALRKLTVLGSALYVAAHPDDENTAMIAWLSRDRLYRTGYLSMTRGDGGQNLLGDEKGELLGVIRTQELLAARRIDGSEQFFTRALDFGYSKGPTETLQIWGHDRILADVVWVIRKFRPDVLITRFPTTGEGGHGHHTASAILAEEAFRDAGDVSKFPEQLRYVQPWKPRRIFWNRFSFGAPIDPNDPSVAHSLRIDLGAYNPMLGRAYTEIAAESRSMHKSQGFGAAERRGTTINYFDLHGGDPATSDIFEGIDTSWRRITGGAAVGDVLERAANNFDPRKPEASLPLLMEALAALDHLATTPAWNPSSNPWTSVKREEILDAIRGCAGLAIDVSAHDSSVIAGAEVPVSVTVINRSDYPFTLSTVGGLFANPSKATNVRLQNNVPVKTELSIKVPADTPISQPYWLVEPSTKGSFTVDDQRLIGLPENPPSVTLNVSLTNQEMQTLIFTVPVVYRWTDPVRGEQVRRLDVVPEVTANFDSGAYLFPEAKARPVTITLHNYDSKDSATVRLVAPAGWSVDPPGAVVNVEANGDEPRATFSVTPPVGETAAVLRAEVDLSSGNHSNRSITNIDYPHIPAQRIFSPAAAKAIREDVRKVGSRVGYIMGAGDEVPDALRQIGYDVVLLTDAELERGEFAGFDAIVAGVRAYNARPAMKLAHAKLMRWVENGGTYVVQYNSLNPQPLLVNPPGPYPFKVTNSRVTVEEAPVQIVDPGSPLLNTPNKIVPADFDGWVQERGVYFTEDWDPKYKTVMASNDPGEPDRAGGEIWTRYGKGVFIYTTYAWFRQLPAGVPGAYKLFANLVSAR